MAELEYNGGFLARSNKEKNGSDKAALKCIREAKNKSMKNDAVFLMLDVFRLFGGKIVDV